MNENRKIVITRLGHSFRDCTTVVTEPLAGLGAHDVLIRNCFAGVNGVYDQMMCANKVEHTPVVPPADAGVEAIGVVENVGADVVGLAVGDAAVTVGAGGGYRKYTICKADDVIAVPAVSREILALIPSGVSALLALERTGEMRSGETVCISAAAGGLGNIATQLAVRAGNHVIAVCGSDEKARWLESVGVARVVQYRSESLAEVLAREYPERIDLAVDSVGAEIFDALLENLAPHARLVVCGATADRLPPVKCLQERVYTRLYWKAASVRGFMNYRFSEYAADARRRLLKMLEGDEIHPLIDAQRFTGLDDVADAVEHLLAGRNLGKVIVELGTE
jgi:NADPH-dependent curcumin reductase CurA